MKQTKERAHLALAALGPFFGPGGAIEPLVCISRQLSKFEGTFVVSGGRPEVVCFASLWRRHWLERVLLKLDLLLGSCAQGGMRGFLVVFLSLDSCSVSEGFRSTCNKSLPQCDRLLSGTGPLWRGRALAELHPQLSSAIHELLCSDRKWLKTYSAVPVSWMSCELITPGCRHQMDMT